MRARILGLVAVLWLVAASAAADVIVRPPPPPPIPNGTLVLNTHPWARVTIDGRVVGNTPVRMQLPAGTHQIDLFVPQCNRTVSVAVQVQAGETVRITRSGLCTPPPPPPPPPPNAPRGRVWINSTPWSQVRLDGRAIGNTPLVGVYVDAGQHTLELRAVCGVKRRRVVIHPGEDYRLTLQVCVGDHPAPPPPRPPHPPRRMPQPLPIEDGPPQATS